MWEVKTVFIRSLPGYRPTPPAPPPLVPCRSRLCMLPGPREGCITVICRERLAFLDAFGPVPVEGAGRAEIMASAIDWIARKIGEPGVGAAFAGVFSDAVSDPALREILSTRLQEPYKIALRAALNEPDERVLLFIDVVTGTLLHRMGMTGEPMAGADVAALTEMVLRAY
jgi:Tetracyclin repressor-like, C-terminal domain